MFFQRRAIEKHLTCRICNKLFDDPRVLPCSHTFCNSCIMSNKKWIDCPKCKARHEIQSCGFPVSGSIVDLLEERAQEVIQSQKVKELRQMLELVDAKCKSLVNSLKIGSDAIKDFCSSLRQKIDLVAERRLHEIRYFNEEFKKQVDEYESECLASYEPLSANIPKELEPFLIEMKMFYQETNKILSRFEVGDDQVDELIKESAEKLSRIDAEERLLERKKFHEHLLLFELEQAKLESSCMGWIKNKYLSLKVSSVKPFNLVAPRDKSIIEVAYSSSNQLIYVAYHVNSYIELAFYDMNGSPVGRSIPIKLYYTYSRFIFGAFLSFLSCKDDCILVMKNTQTTHNQSYYYQVYYTDSNAYNLIWNTQTFFVKINKDRDYVSCLGVSHNSEFQAANSSNIFCFDRANSKVWVYTSNLAVGASHFTENIPVETKGLQANEENIFILHKDSDQMKVRVVEIANKTVKQEVSLPSVNFNQFKVISAEYLIAFNNQENTLSLVYSNNPTIPKFDHYVAGLDKNLWLSKDNSPYLFLFNQHEIKCCFFVENYCDQNEKK